LAAFIIRFTGAVDFITYDKLSNDKSDDGKSGGVV
jgi:hypothetical protein